MQACDFGYSDDELKAMSIEARNALLDDVNADFANRASEQGDDLPTYFCRETGGDHDWSDEPTDPRNPNSPTYLVCIACHVQYDDYLAA